MIEAIKGLTLEPGFIVIATNSGPPTRFPIAEVLRATDIPALTQEQVVAIKALANLTVVLIRTLIERKVLDESFIDSQNMHWDLEHIIQAIELMGGNYSEHDFDDAGENP